VIGFLEGLVMANLTLPRVDDPWPDSIGLGFPFAIGGAAGVLASLVAADTSQAERDRAIRLGNLWGFRLGAGFYLLSLIFQVAYGR
jgi:hypothetical protein